MVIALLLKVNKQNTPNPTLSQTNTHTQTIHFRLGRLEIVEMS